MSGNKILIVDDDQDLLRGLGIRLKANGYQIIVAENAGSAIEMAEKEKPDLIILDLGLPGDDGFVVMKRLKTKPQTASIPIIIFSARDPVVNEEKALLLGAEVFFQKPIDNEVLLATIRKALDPH